jgi:hypothetical protein
MRRHAATLFIFAAHILLAPGALGQSASHPVTVSVPNYIGLRIVGSGAAHRSVVFDLATSPIGYLAAADAGQPLAPTAVTHFDDIEVNVVGFGLWSVNVVATAFDYAGSGTGSGLDLGDVRMVRGSVSGLRQTAIRIFGSYDTSWSLSTAPQRIARSFLGTRGWRSLGFNGSDYSLAVNGDEDAGTYTTTVTYFLTFP